MNYTKIENTRLCFVMPNCGDIIEIINVNDVNRSYTDGDWKSFYWMDNFNPDLIEILFELEHFVVYEVSDIYNEKLNKTEKFYVRLDEAYVNMYERASAPALSTSLFINSARPSHIAVDLVPHEVRKLLEGRD